jgi:hypothetical protein
MVEELPRQVPIESVAASADGKMPELPQNGALPKNVAESQVTSVWGLLEAFYLLMFAAKRTIFFPFLPGFGRYSWEGVAVASGQRGDLR